MKPHTLLHNLNNVVKCTHSLLSNNTTSEHPLLSTFQCLYVAYIHLVYITCFKCSTGREKGKKFQILASLDTGKWNMDYSEAHQSTA